MIKYVKGDATRPEGEGNKLVIHIVNDVGRFGSGFALAVLKRYPKVREAYISGFDLDVLEHTSGKNDLKLGDVQFVKVADDLWFANMVGQHGVIGPTNPMPIQYDAVRECLRKVCEFATANSMKIFAPKFGSGLAGGKWIVIEKLIQDELTSKNLDITIYEL